MAFDVVNVGTIVNDGTGDTLRAGGVKINANFAKAVEGPASATADGIAVYNSTTGKLIKDSGVTVQQVVDGLIGKFTWDSNTTSPASSVTRAVPPALLENLYDKIRGCLVNDNGTINYYLNPTDWSLKDVGGASVLTGADGQVMVEIPKFYYRVSSAGTETTWEISPVPLGGFAVHPAFVKDGVEVSHRYYGAYDACVFDDSASAYISGLNWDNNSGAGNGVEVDVTATTGDVLASVAGVYPMVGLTRAEFRTIAANRGAGWRQLDFHLWQAVGLLYLVEYQTFYNQDELGAGNTNGGYFTASGTQNDSPHTIAGAGDSWANGSTDGSQPSAGAKPGTAYMKYRGIENFFGNCWNWADGININVTATGNVHITNNAANWADNTGTNYTLITGSLTTGSANIQTLLPVAPWFLAGTTGGTGAQYITDRHFGTASSSRVAFVGGSASNGVWEGLIPQSERLYKQTESEHRRRHDCGW